MTTEMTCLFWAIVLGLLHVLVTGMFTTGRHGVAYGLSSRDEARPPGLIGGRVQRAFSNYMQTFPFFAAAVLATHVLDRHGAMTEWGAQLYLWSRVAFPFLYAGNVIGARSLAYLVSVAGIAMVLLGLR